MRNTAFLVLTALILALGGYWFMTRTGEVGDPGALAPALETDSASLALGDSTALPEAQQSPSTNSVSAASDRSEVSAPAPKTPVVAELAQTISGRVLDTLGTPVAGATVRIGTQATMGGLLLDRALASSDRDKDTSKVTDSAGRFLVTSARRGDLVVEVNCPGYAPLRLPKSVPNDDVLDIGDLEIEGGVRLVGHVVDGSGTGIPGVQLRQSNTAVGGFRIQFPGQSGELLATTGSSGEFEVNELTAGPFALSLTHELHPSLRVEGSTKRPGETLGDLRYVLEDGHAISGVVRELGAGENSKYVVRAYPGKDMMAAAESQDFYADLGLAKIAGDGRFRLQGLREGSYRLQLILAEVGESAFANGQSATVIARTGDTNVELALREPLGVTFRVVDASSGEACRKYQATVGDGWLAMPNRSSTEHEDGRTTIESVDVRGDSSSADIRITADGYRAATLENVTLMPGVVKDIGVILLEPVPVVTVEVLDATSRAPIPGARVSLGLMPPDMQGMGRRMSINIDDGDEDDLPDPEQFLGRESTRGKTDENGVAELASMPGERCKLTASHSEYAKAELLNVELPMTGEMHLVMEMTRGGSVTVTVYDAEGKLAEGVLVDHVVVGSDSPVILGGTGAPKTGADGTIVFEHLAPGTHNFKIMEAPTGSLFNSSGGQVVIMGAPPSGDPGEDVLVTEGAELAVTLHKKPEGYLDGELTEAGQPLAGAALSFKEKRAGAHADPMAGLPGFDPGKETRSNGSGVFHIEGLKVGTYTVTIRHPERIMPMEYEVTIRAGKNKVAYDLPLAIIEGRVKDVDGKPVAGIDVRPQRYRAPGSGRQQRMVMTMVRSDGGGGSVTVSGGPSTDSARTDAEGRYILRGVTPDVELVVECSSDKYQKAQSDRVSVEANETKSKVHIEVHAAGSLRITVRKADGTPGEFCLVTLEYADAAEPSPDSVREFTGESGVASAASLRPGYWRVSGSEIQMGPNGGGQEPRTTETAEVEIVAGETAELTLELD